MPFHTHTHCNYREKIILYGKSLGGAVALALTEHHPEHIMAIILENTFLSIPAMVDVLLPLVKYFKALILRIGWRSDERIQNVTQPLLFISGLADELVPPSHMMQLKRLATRSKYAQVYTVADGTHNDTMFKGGIAYYRTFREFILRVAYTTGGGGGGGTGEEQQQHQCTAEEIKMKRAAALGGQEGGGGDRSIPTMPRTFL